MKPNEDPRPALLDTLRYIVTHVEEHGFQPRLQEIAARFGITQGGVAFRLRQLERLGYVRCTRRGRAVELINIRFRAEVIEEPAEEEGGRIAG